MLRYLRGILKLCLSFEKGKPILERYTDADMSCDLEGKNLHLHMYLLLRGELYHDNTNYKNALHYSQ